MKSRAAATAVSLLFIAAIFPTSSRAQVAGSDWLGLLNTYRAIAGVSPTKEDPKLSDAAAKHASYIIQNGALSADESPGSPGYTPAGDAAARVSIQLGVNDSSYPDEQFVETWLATAFYGPLMLNPEMLYAGFGSARNPSASTIRNAGVMDVNRGATEDNTYARYPVAFPGDGSIVPLTTAFGVEQPDPLSSCPGFTRPAGQPITLQLKRVEPVQSFSLQRDGVPVTACAFDATSYVNSNQTNQAIGRGFLEDRRAIVLMPRETLAEGSTYAVSITTDSATYAWSFAIGDVPVPSPNVVTGGEGSDDLSGSTGADVMFGADGADTIEGLGGADALYGGEGADEVEGQGNADLVSGGLGRDRLSGGGGNDRLSGGNGDDVVKGGSGTNRLDGGKGRDVCVTSSRKDVLVSCEKVVKKRAH